MNGHNMSRDDATKWFLGQNHDDLSGISSISAHEADLVAISLQECPTLPSIHINSNSMDHFNIPYISGSSYEEEPHSHFAVDQVRNTLASALSPDHSLLADLAMGQAPSSVSHSDGEVTKWYGYIRLIVWTKPSVMEYIKCKCKEDSRRAVIPIVVPAGKKRMDTQMDTYPSQNEHGNETMSCSPDKGGVCLAIPCLRILLCSLHLCGTNAYHTPEDVFDLKRIREWNTVVEACSRALASEESTTNSCSAENLNDYEYVTCGDLNFRVEMCVDPKDKSRGGRDFLSACSLLRRREDDNSNNMWGTNELFLKYDRLVRLFKSLSAWSADGTETQEEESSIGKDHVHHELSSSLSTTLSYILRNSIDTFMMYLTCTSKRDVTQGMGRRMLPPTFSFPTNYQPETLNIHQREYSDKRTPSWTDRILFSKGLLQSHTDIHRGKYRLGSCGAEYSVETSDHVPVFAVLLSS